MNYLVKLEDVTTIHYAHHGIKQFVNQLLPVRVQKRILLKNINLTIKPNTVYGLYSEDIIDARHLLHIIGRNEQVDIGQASYFANSFYFSIEYIMKHFQHSTLNEISSQLSVITNSNISLKKINVQHLYEEHSGFGVNKKNVQFDELADKPLSSFTYGQNIITIMKLLEQSEFNLVLCHNLSLYLNDKQMTLYDSFIQKMSKEGKSIVLSEQLEFLKNKSDELIWLSYGQIREHGKVSIVYPNIRNYYYEKNKHKSSFFSAQDNKLIENRKSLTDVDSEDLSRLKRRNLYQMNPRIRNLLLLTGLCVIVLCICMFLLYKNITLNPLEQGLISTSEEKVIQEKPTITEQSGIVVMTESKHVKSKSQAYNVPVGAALSTESYTEQIYNVELGQEIIELSKQDLIYINKAALYNEKSMDELQPYMDITPVSIQRVQNNFIGESKDNIFTAGNGDHLFIGDEGNDFIQPVAAQNFSMLFNGSDEAIGFVVKAKKAKALEKEFKNNIDDGRIVFRVNNGFVVYQQEHKLWTVLYY